MSIKTILVPVEKHDLTGSIFQTALLLAQKFDSYIEGVAVRPPILSVLAVDIPNVVEMEALEHHDAQSVRYCRDLFEAFMEAHKVPRWNQSDHGLSFAWLDTAPDGYDFLGRYGRSFDIVIVGRPNSDSLSPRSRVAEQCLFESGRPILLVPPSAPQQLGENILISWNFSKEQARATAFAMPLLQRAARVVVLTVDHDRCSVPSGEKLAKNLRFHGISADVVTIRASGHSVGEAILAHARSGGYDLLIKGAYTQSRLKQMLFGGTTRHILEKATIPVLMAY